jgi:hypothetical protein
MSIFYFGRWVMHGSREAMSTVLEVMAVTFAGSLSAGAATEGSD